LVKKTKFSIYFFVFIISQSCSSVSSIVSMTANAGISSKGFSASVDDTFLKTKIFAKISKENLSNLTDISVSVSLGEVLLTGYSGDQISRLKLVQNVMQTEGVKKVYNEVQINPSISFSERTEDALFESRLMTRMLFKSGINSNNFSLDVVSGNVYIIGLAENLEEKTVVEKFFSEMDDIRNLITIINIKKKDEKK
tara:strand:+ start:478 stop:1065 length:588 start_codon:yes stop_codon:yes gene_type:complete